jgi:Na+-driven multidrug efflux pump
MTFSQLAIMFVLGVCMGMQPIVGFNYGAQRFDRLKRAYWLTVAVGTAVCALGTLVSEACPHLVARIFTSDEALLDTCSHAFRLMNIAFWVAGFQIVPTNFFQSLGEAAKSIFMSLSRQVICLLPFLFILPSIFKLDGVWYSFPASDLISALMGVVLLTFEMHKINRLVRNSVRHQD